jgi:type I restriction enzyme S subunit
MTRIGDIGTARLIDWDVNASFYVSLALIKQNNSFISSFLVQSIASEYFQRELWRRIIHVAFPKKINLGEIGRCLINLPSLPEQQKISDFLASVDDKIQALTRKVNLLKDYKKGVMQKIFKQEIRFKNDDGEEFGEWENIQLGNLTTKTGKKNKENIQYPIYSINNKEGFLPQSDQFKGMDSNDRGYDISLYKIIKEKTFAYNPARINVGSIGYSGNLNNIIISSLYVCFTTNDSVYDLFLLQYLNTYNFNKAVLRNVEGGVRQYLFYDNFSTIKMPLPQIEEQVKITNYLSTIDQKIKTTEHRLEKMNEWKKGLLQKMFV